MPEAELWQLSAVEVAAGIRTRTFTSREVVDAVLDRIAALNPRLNAIVVERPDEARARADDADAAVARGDELGPLHGVPVTIKENIDQVGYPTTNGVAAFADLMPSQDSPVVTNLTRAGAVFIGRTNTPEFSMRPTTDNPLRGRTYNPWDDDASPGGSSGGAGAAAAAGFGPLHHGNDIGGSLRFPSSANGVVTVKPGTFRVPTFNSSAPAERGPLSQAMSSQGVIARHAADVRLATEVLVRPDWRDPNAPPVPFFGTPIDGPVSVAVTTESHGFPIHPDMVGLINRAAGILADAGYAVEEAEPPSVLEAAGAWFRTGSTEMKAVLAPAVDKFGSKDIQAVFDHFFARSTILDRDGYIAEFGDRTRMMREWGRFLDRHPLVLTPFMMDPLFAWDADLDPAGMARLLDGSIYSFSMNYLGLPAGVIGMDLVEGLPAAVQVVGRRFREDLICDALEVIEQTNGPLAFHLWDRADGEA
ncbi:MAG: amidase [Acidimicrobiales bacterium]